MTFVSELLRQDTRAYPRTLHEQIPSASTDWQGATTSANPGRYAEEEQRR
jgi:hypothetical protein